MTSAFVEGVTEVEPDRSPGRSFARALLSLELLAIGILAIGTALVVLYQVVLELAGEHGHFPRHEYLTYGLVVGVLAAGGGAFRATRLLRRNEARALRLLGIVAVTFLVLFALSRQRPEMALVSIAVGTIAILHIAGAGAMYAAVEHWFARAPERVLHPLAAVVGIVVAATSLVVGAGVVAIYTELSSSLGDPLSPARQIRLWAIQLLPSLLSLLGYLAAIMRFGRPGRFLATVGGLGMLIATGIAFLLHPLVGLIWLIPPVTMIVIAASMDIPDEPYPKRPGSGPGDGGWLDLTTYRDWSRW